VNRVSELQMTHILKSLLEGLTSPILDYVAGSYTIVAQLTRRTQLSHQIFCGIVHKIAEVCSTCTVLTSCVCAEIRGPSKTCISPIFVSH
jgi:hypothetical protein